MKLLRKTRGFTLIELLAVLMIFSLLALMSYRGLGAVLDSREHIKLETKKWRGVADFLSRFERDLLLAAPRPMRTLSGNAPAWRGSPAGTQAPNLEFSRFATADGVDAPRRLGYTLNEKKEIELWLWPGLDVAPATTPERYPVLSGVGIFELKYLNAGLAWVDAWPVPGQEATLPRAVQLRMVLVSGEEIMRVFAL